jgi:hypothetical protein
MGERSNIIIENQDGNRVYLYGHWMGEQSIEIVGTVLDRGLRWYDEGYLTRMLFCEMTREDTSDGELGFGITTYLCDSNYPSIVIDCTMQKIHLESGQGKKMSNYISFANFIQMMPRNSFEALEASLSSDYFSEPLTTV